MTDERTARAATRAIGWSFLGLAASRLVTLAGLAALARLLAPADFGLLAFALVSIAYVETIADLGVGAALVYWPSRTADAAQVAFVLNVALAGVWLALTIALASPVAAFFGSPPGEAILRVLAWTFPIRALGATHDALCQKELKFRARIVPEVGQAAVKAVFSVALALAGFGVWSLVWGHLLGLLAWTLLLWIVVPWRPRRYWPAGLLGPMLTYGRGVVAVNLVAAVTHHADIVVVGRMLGSVTLGFYQMAAKVPEMTITVLVWVTSRVLFPAFSRMHAEGQAVGDAYLAALRYVSAVSVPAAVGLAALGEPLVLTVFGETWRPAAPVLRALAAYAGVRSLSTPAGDVLKALGRPGLLAALGVLRALVLVPSMIAAARFGAVTVAVALASVTAVALFVNTGVACRLTRVTGAQVVEAVRASLLAGAALALVLIAWDRASAGMAPGAVLAGGGILGLGAYALAVRVLSPDVYRRARRAFVGPTRVDEP